MNRICIYTKDIQIITGKSEKHCRNIIVTIKKVTNKQKHQPITVEEFCCHMGMNPAQVMPLIR